MTAYINKLKDKSGNQQLPVTHERAVRDDNGTTLESKMQNLEGAMDKAYVASSDNGMGRITLKKNMVSGVNTLTQSMMQATNTIYVIQYDFTLGEDITIPSNSILKFEGGSLNGDNYTYKLLEVVGFGGIIAGEQQIFYNVATDADYIESEWIGIHQYNWIDHTHNSEKLNSFIANHIKWNVQPHKLVINFKHRGEYHFTEGIVIPYDIAVHLKGSVPKCDNMTTLRADSFNTTFFTVKGNLTAENIFFKGNTISYNNYLIDFSRDDPQAGENANDTDSVINNCAFAYAQTASIRLTGRQSLVKSCNFAQCTVGVLIDDYLTTGSSGGPGRNNRIIDCHFHANALTCIKCVGLHQRHLTIEGNISDGADSKFFEGYLLAGRIINNDVHYPGLTNTGKDEIICLYAASDSFITGNKFNYTDDFDENNIHYNSILEHFITASQTVSNTVIENNMFGACTDHGFVFTNVNNVSISNNTFKNVGEDKYLIYISGNNSTFVASNNVFLAASPALANKGIVNNCSSIQTYAPGYSDNAICKTFQISNNSTVRIGSIINDSCNGGALIACGTRNESGHTLNFLDVKRNVSNAPSFVSCECISSQTGYVEFYIDANYNIYLKNTYPAGPAIVSILTFGYAVSFVEPVAITSEEIAQLTLTDITLRKKGTTAQRPSAVIDETYLRCLDGFCYYDITIHKPIYVKVVDNGSSANPRYTLTWVDATGNPV